MQKPNFFFSPPDFFCLSRLITSIWGCDDCQGHGGRVLFFYFSSLQLGRGSCSCLGRQGWLSPAERQRCRPLPAPNLQHLGVTFSISTEITAWSMQEQQILNFQCCLDRKKKSGLMFWSCYNEWASLGWVQFAAWWSWGFICDVVSSKKSDFGTVTPKRSDRRTFISSRSDFRAVISQQKWF